MEMYENDCVTLQNPWAEPKYTYLAKGTVENIMFFYSPADSHFPTTGIHRKL